MARRAVKPNEPGLPGRENAAGASDLLGFVTSSKRLVLLEAGPRGGKSTALFNRANLLGVSTLYCGVPPDAGAAPAHWQTEALLAWAARRYSELGRKPKRVSDYEELRRFFGEQCAALPGMSAPWFEAYCAAKRTRQLKTQHGLGSIIARHGLAASGGRSAMELLADAVRTMDVSMAAAQMITPWDALTEIRAWLDARPDRTSLVLDGMEHVCVDDVQLLTTHELELILTLAKGGAKMSLALGRWQCFNQRDGGVGLTFMSRLQTAGFSKLTGRRAPGLRPAQVDTMLIATDNSREAPFKAGASGPFAVSYARHENEVEAYARIATLVREDSEVLSQGQCAVLTPVPEMARYIAGALSEAGADVALRGRRTLQGSPSYLIASAVATAVRTPDDLVALRQIATLWLDELASFEAVAKTAFETGVTLLQAAEDSAEQANFAAMNEWLQDVADGEPSEVPEKLIRSPHWVASEDMEAGIALWRAEVERAGCARDWKSRWWTSIAARAFDGYTMVDPHPEHRLVVACVQDTAGCAWTRVDLVGMSDGLLPGPSLPQERVLETHALLQIFSRATQTLTLHHIEAMAMGPNGREIKLQPSIFSARMGMDEPPAENTPSVGGPRAQLRPW